MSSVLKDGLAKERKGRGGPCEENNMSRRTEAHEAGRDIRCARDAGQSHMG